MNARQTALGGTLTALAVTLLTMGSLIPMATFCAPLLAMAALLPVLEECGVRAAGAAWGAVSVLGMLLAADRAALVYVFFGWYPLVRPALERLSPAPLRLGAKLAGFYGALALLYGVVVRVLGLPEESQPRWLPAVLTAMAAVTFLLADRLLARLTLLWRFKLRKRFFR